MGILGERQANGNGAYNVDDELRESRIEVRSDFDEDDYVAKNGRPEDDRGLKAEEI